MIIYIIYSVLLNIESGKYEICRRQSVGHRIQLESLEEPPQSEKFQIINMGKRWLRGSKSGVPKGQRVKSVAWDNKSFESHPNWDDTL